MADVLHRITKQHRLSVNTPDFPVMDWIVNPDLDKVNGFPSKYWIITGDVVSLMDQKVRDTVDVQEATDARTANRNANKLRINNESVLKAFALIVLDEVNILRSKHGLSNRTQAQFIRAIESRVDTI